MRVLIVDDEVLIEKCLKRLALSRGHIVKTENNGLRALKLWPRFKPHLVFLDVFLPGLDGLSLLKKMSKKNNEKVVMMSAHKVLPDGAFIPGVDLFVSKPFLDIVRFFEQAEGLFKEKRDLVL